MIELSACSSQHTEYCNAESNERSISAHRGATLLEIPTAQRFTHLCFSTTFFHVNAVKSRSHLSLCFAGGGLSVTAMAIDSVSGSRVVIKKLKNPWRTNPDALRAFREIRLLCECCTQCSDVLTWRRAANILTFACGTPI